MIRHLYTLCSDHPNKSSTHLAPHIVITILLTIFPVLYFTSSWIFCNCSCVLLQLYLPSPFLPVLPNPVSSADCQFVLCIYKFVSVSLVSLFWFSDSTYKWNHTVFVFAVWLSSLSAMPSRLIHVASDDRISFFFMSEWQSIVYMCHVFFIHLSVNGHLACFLTSWLL